MANNLLGWLLDFFDKFKNFGLACWNVLTTPFNESIEILPNWAQTIISNLLDITNLADNSLIDLWPIIASVSLVLVVVRAFTGD